MPRQPRAVAIGYPHHVTQRGNNREPVFLESQDYQTYLQRLICYAKKYEIRVWAYCLMKNHIHLLVAPGKEDSLARGIGATNLTYTQYFNKKYDRSGRIWQNRFFSCIVGHDEYLWNVVRYIETNPVKAGILSDPEGYPWSSAKAHCRGDYDPVLERPGWLEGLTRLGYRKSLARVNGTEDEVIRKTTRSGRFYGCSKTRAQLETDYGFKLTSRPRGRPRRK